MEQLTDDWYKARLGKATASAFHKVFSKGMTRENYKVQLALERLTGVPTESFTSAAMEFGTANEADAREIYKLITDREVQEVGFVPIKGIEAGASPDGLVDEDGLVEIKCPNSATHISTLLKGKIKPEYISQMQGQMWATGRKWCDFVSYDPRMPVKKAIKIIRVDRDDDFIANLKDEVTKFLAEVDELEAKLKD